MNYSAQSSSIEQCITFPKKDRLKSLSASQQTFTCSKSPIGIVEKGVKYVQN